MKINLSEDQSEKLLKDTDEYYFVIWSHSNRIMPTVGYSKRQDIIDLAQDELSSQGQTLEDMSNLEWIISDDEDADPVPERELTEEEIFKYSIEKLQDDERLFEVFYVDEENTKKFIEASKRYKLEEEAIELVKDFLEAESDF